MKAKFDNNGNLAISAENAEEKDALKSWFERQVDAGFISEDILTSESSAMVILLGGFDVTEGV